MNINSLRRSLTICLVCLGLFLANLRSLVIWDLHPDYSSLTGPAWIEVYFWFLAFLMVIYLLVSEKQLSAYMLSWSRQGVLSLFLIICALSLFWAVDRTASLHRVLVLIASTAVASYFGMRFNLQGILRGLFWFGVIIVVTSLFLIIFIPALGTDLNPPYNGAWRGVFWHKNHLGSLASLLNLIFLILLFDKDFSTSFIKKGFGSILYLLSLVLVVYSRSAAGYILVFILHAGFIFLFLWLRFARQLHRAHYLVLGAVIGLGIFLVLLNLDFILGLLNRDATLTGRMSLWAYLFQAWVSHRPWFGYGFGSVWAVETFRLKAQQALGWRYPVMIGDNGFMDLLLNGGLVGLIFFLGVYIKAWVVCAQRAFAHPALINLFTLLIMVFSFFGNLSFSLFMEIEVFVWGLIVAILFSSNDTRSQSDRMVPDLSVSVT
jgi:exopolysaccharide production protein ExoQ